MNHSTTDKNFEQQKNIKAAAYTSIIASIIFTLFLLVSWQIPQIPPPVASEGIEVNLGNSDFGMGNVEPEIPGPPTNEVQETPSNTLPSEPQQNTMDEDDKGDEAINNTPKTITPKPIVTKPITPNKSTTTPNPAPPKPKAVFGGATTKNVGGNNADSYNGVKNQGINGGIGNQGNPNGNPNSDSYKGNANSGNSGVSIRSGLNGRRLVKLPSFQDDFNEDAKVFVDVTVDANGKVIAAIVNPRGTTTTNANIKKIAINKANQLRFNAGNTEQTGTIAFVFKANG
jgi:hypothetical protein